LFDSAELVCAGALGGIFPHSAECVTICLGKSTYARCGIIVNVTPFEPEWEGFVTLEISNTTPLPAKIYANEGLCQVLFLKAMKIAKSATRTRKGSTSAERIVLPVL